MPEPEPRLQLQACILCNRRKKKCSRHYPSCTYCEINGWKCEYSTPRRPNTIEQEPRRQGTLAETNFGYQTANGLEEPVTSTFLPLAQRSGDVVFPPAFFLDADLFEQCQLKLPEDFPSIPLYIQPFIGDHTSTRDAATKYFDEIHRWLPIVAKKRLFKQLLNSLSATRADIRLLIIAMRLVTIYPVDSGTNLKNPMYLAAKRYFAEAEMLGVLTIPCLQAAVLISVYEFGHAIYPAAFFSVAACIRFATSLGISDKESLCKHKSLTWVEVEERRRIWWAISIMDRCINFGCPSRALATNEPGMDSILPVDDTAWDEAGDEPVTILTLSSSASLQMGQFTRFAQAAHLEGLVFRHVSDGSVDESFHKEEKDQLQRTLGALAKVSLLEARVRNLSFCSQISTCYSALLVLQQSDMAAQEDDSYLEFTSDGFHLTLKPNAILLNSSKIAQSLSSLRVETISPFILHLFYQCSLFLMRNNSTQLIANSSDMLRQLKQGIMTLSTKWRVSGAYLDMLQARESWDD